MHLCIRNVCKWIIVELSRLAAKLQHIYSHSVRIQSTPITQMLVKYGNVSSKV